MADNSSELLLKLEALKASLDAGFSGVHAKLDDIRNDIKVIAEARLAPLEQKQLRTGSSPNWPRPVDADDLKEG